MTPRDANGNFSAARPPAKRRRKPRNLRELCPHVLNGTRPAEYITARQSFCLECGTLKRGKRILALLFGAVLGGRRRWEKALNMDFRPPSTGTV